MWCCMFTFKILVISILKLFRWYFVLCDILCFLCNACLEFMASKYQEASPKYGSMLPKIRLFSTTVQTNKPLLLSLTNTRLLDKTVVVHTNKPLLKKSRAAVLLLEKNRRCWYQQQRLSIVFTDGGMSSGSKIAAIIDLNRC